MEEEKKEANTYYIKVLESIITDNKSESFKNIIDPLVQI